MVHLAVTALKRFMAGKSPVIVLFILLLTSLYLLGGATQNSELFGRLYSLLLVINILTILLLFTLIGRHLYQLIKQYRSRITGSRLTARLVIMFVVLSVTPVSVVYYFSLEFLKRGIDSWFDVRVEKALNDALELSQASLGIRTQELLRQTRLIAKQVKNTPNELAALALNDLGNKSEATELTIFSTTGRIVASSSKQTDSLIPQRLSDTAYITISQDLPDIGLVPTSKDQLSVRIALHLPANPPVTKKRILQALYNTPERISILADSVQTAYGNYNELAYMRIPLKYSFILTLSLVLLLSILTAIWAAFFHARRLMAPITDLVEGTRAVAAGDYDKRLPLPGRDELGFLVHSFNQMTSKIALAQEAAKASQKQVEQQNAYLEVVLAHLSSGVLTFDEQYRLHSSNTTADQILGLELLHYYGQPLQNIVDEHAQIQQFADIIQPHLEDKEQEWRDEATLFGTEGRQILMCRGTSLPHTVTLQGGHVVVFDDITNLLQAQRNAAWGEVARRLAHEIKNPLTPIQLSAERLRHKYLAKMAPEDAEVLDRSTHTIVQQVETLKEMVKAFSDYARMPTLQLQRANLNTIITEVRELYHNEATATKFTLHLDNKMPVIEADVGRMRQLLHNLIKNALEAMPADHQGMLRITTHCVEKHKCGYVELRIEDNGPGIPENMFNQLFEPYVTSKPKGSGLGLAIVKKIVEEHGGVIWAENRVGGGTAIILLMPVVASDTQSEDHDTVSLIMDKNNDAVA